jgi:hypothetical protein
LPDKISPPAGNCSARRRLDMVVRAPHPSCRCRRARDLEQLIDRELLQLGERTAPAARVLIEPGRIRVEADP